jgi:hypothetical protein
MIMNIRLNLEAKHLDRIIRVIAETRHTDQTLRANGVDESLNNPPWSTDHVTDLTQRSVYE